MEQEKFKKLITSMALSVMTGSIDTRIQYLGVMIDHLSYYIRNEKLSKSRPEILNTRQRLVDAFNFLLAANVEKFRLNEQQRHKIQSDFTNRIIVLDPSWNTPAASFGTQTLRELEALVMAKQHYFRAVAAHSEYLSGSAVGLTNATGEAANAMRIVMQVCYDNNFVEISEGEWRKSVTSPAAPPETSKR